MKMKRRLLFGSVASVAVICLLLVSSFAMAGTSKNDPGGPGEFETSVVTTTRYMSFSAPGRVAIFTVTVTGSGVLSVDMSDYNPSTYPDYWRATIVVYQAGGYAARVSDVAVTNVGTPGTGTGWGPFSGRTDMLVAYGFTYLVLISYERGVNVWTAGCTARFFYSGPSMVVSAAPRTGF